MSSGGAAELRRFGLGVGGMFLLLGALSRWRGHVWPPAVLITLGVLLVIPGLAAPTVLGPVRRVWMRGAMVIGEVNSRIILGVMYFLVFAPVGFVMRESIPSSNCLRNLLKRRRGSLMTRAPPSPGQETCVKPPRSFSSTRS